MLEQRPHLVNLNFNSSLQRLLPVCHRGLSHRRSQQQQLRIYGVCKRNKPLFIDTWPQSSVRFTIPNI